MLKADLTGKVAVITVLIEGLEEVLQSFLPEMVQMLLLQMKKA